MHSLQEITKLLLNFWEKEGCLSLPPYDLPSGAGTFHPACFFGVLKDNACKVVYVAPCRRPSDGRYGLNPHRLQHYFQLQVILKPGPDNIREIYMKSLVELGIDLEHHDIRFIEDDWEQPSLGAVGLGWEVRLDNLEITQFTYFQQMAGIQLFPIPVEITYGLERLAIFIQKKGSIFELNWDDNLSYGDLFLKREEEYSDYNFNKAKVASYFKLFSIYEEELKFLLEEKLLGPAYDNLLTMSHLFNILEARSAISHQQRTYFISKLRNYANLCANLYLQR
jgi:glycyl-tRNA synthetase alpha chain